MKLCNLLKIMALILILASCENETVEPTTQEDATLGGIQDLELNSPEVLSLKKRLIGNEGKIEGKTTRQKFFEHHSDIEGLDWSKAYKKKEDDLFGVFVPYKRSIESDVRVLASLNIGGEMQQFVITNIEKVNPEGVKRRIINFYRLNGNLIKRHIYENNILVELRDYRKPKNISARLKTAQQECAVTGCIDDYNTWFNASSSDQRFGNNTDQVIKYKKETSGYGYLQPGEYTTERIDGFRIGNTVHKVTNNYNTFGVKGEGDYDHDYNPAYYVVYVTIGGDLDESPGSDWDGLFD